MWHCESSQLQNLGQWTSKETIDKCYSNLKVKSRWGCHQQQFTDLSSLIETLQVKTTWICWAIAFFFHNSPEGFCKQQSLNRMVHLYIIHMSSEILLNRKLPNSCFMKTKPLDNMIHWYKLGFFCFRPY